MDEVYWIRGYRSYHPVLRPEWLWIEVTELMANGCGNIADSLIAVTNWANREPNDTPTENCMAVFGNDAASHHYESWFRWLNYLCGAKLGYICEKED